MKKNGIRWEENIGMRKDANIVGKVWVVHDLYNRS